MAEQIERKPLELVTVKARTRGKTPVEFTYQGIGKVTPRNVKDKDNQDIILNASGNTVSYSFDKDGKVTFPEIKNDKGEIVPSPAITQDKDGNLILPEGFRFVVVDDLDTSGVTDNLKDVVDLFGTIPSDTSALQRVIDGALNWFNVLSRKEASPVVEVEKEDELSPIVAELVAAGILSADNVAVWRRTVSTGAKSIEEERIDFAARTKEVKKLRKLQEASKVPAAV